MHTQAPACLRAGSYRFKHAGVESFENVPYLQQKIAGTARLAQSAERKALNLVVVGSSPTVGALLVRKIRHAALMLCMRILYTHKARSPALWGKKLETSP